MFFFASPIEVTIPEVVKLLFYLGFLLLPRYPDWIVVVPEVQSVFYAAANLPPFFLFLVYPLTSVCPEVQE